MGSANFPGVIEVAFGALFSNIIKMSKTLRGQPSTTGTLVTQDALMNSQVMEILSDSKKRKVFEHARSQFFSHFHHRPTSHITYAMTRNAEFITTQAQSNETRPKLNATWPSN